MKKTLKFFMVLMLSVMFVAMNVVTASAAVNENTQTTPDEKYSVIQTVNDTVLAEARNEQAPEIAGENQDEAQSDTTDNSLTLEGDENANEVAATASTPDTWITGQLTWRDHNNAEQPLRFCKIKITRTDTLIDYTIYEGYTDQNGEYYVEFTNDALDGLVDLEIEVFAEGTDIKVKDADNDLYSDVIEQKDISVGEHTISHAIYTMDSTLGQALQILQAGICASMYYEAMKGEDVDDVDIIYPHEEPNEDCYYRNYNDINIFSNDRIYMRANPGTQFSNLPSYASWDVVTHEYGHHVADSEGIDDSPGGWHAIKGNIAEHYVRHFSSSFDPVSSCQNQCALIPSNGIGFKFSQDECKYKGATLSWSEGFALFFGEVAQQYFKDNYIEDQWDDEIHTFADYSFYAYTFNDDYDSGRLLIEENDPSIVNTELEVSRILFDLYDSNGINGAEAFDNVSWGHQGIWDYIVNGGTDIDGDGEKDHITKAKTLYQFIEYLRSSDSGYPKSQLSNLNAILAAHGLATEAPAIPSMTVDSPLIEFVWNTSVFTTYFDANKFQVNFYDANYNLIGSTEPQVINLEFVNDYYIVVYSGEITVDSQLWQTVMSYPSNFYVSITIYECNGDINNSITDEHTTSFESPYTMYFSSGHIHDYTNLHLKHSSSQHKSYCLCGDFIYESHFFVSGLVYPSCRDCGYIRTGNTPIIKPTTADTGEETYGYLPPENESAYTTENSRTKEN